MRQEIGVESCKELEVRIDGKIATGFGGVYDLQSEMYDGKRKYVKRSSHHLILKYNAQRQYWQV